VTIADVVLCILGGAALGVVVAMLIDGDPAMAWR
jgi:hypothetical protein